jgi:DNA-binding response OmpR family regulator
VISIPKPKAIVVDDDPTVAGMVAYFLELQGITCLHAPTAETGWDMVMDEHLAMAVVDLRLPGKDGWWLVEQIRSDGRLGSLPVVVVTGYQETDVASRARVLGSGCLAKPFSYDELNEQLAEASELAERWKRA